MKILLLEDDLELCSSIQSQLTKNGYMVDACNDGEIAMLYALHTDYSYDLAIVDRMLPVIDGLTINKRPRSKLRGIERGRPTTYSRICYTALPPVLFYPKTRIIKTRINRY